MIALSILYLVIFCLLGMLVHLLNHFFAAYGLLNDEEAANGLQTHLHTLGNNENENWSANELHIFINEKVKKLENLSHGLQIQQIELEALTASFKQLIKSLLHLLDKESGRN